jgi:hypothetical protein
MKRVMCLVLLLAVSTLARLEAMLVVPMTFEQLVDEAAAVVYARVSDVRGQWTSDRRSIDSVVTLEALRYLKGGLGDALALRLPGGEANGVINVIPGAPVLHEGELVVLFLKAQGPAIPTTLGMGQGVFRVRRDSGTGGMLVTPPPLKESAAGRVVRGAADRRALTVDALAESVRARTAAGAAAAHGRVR